LKSSQNYIYLLQKTWFYNIRVLKQPTVNSDTKLQAIIGPKVARLALFARPESQSGTNTAACQDLHSQNTTAACQHLQHLREDPRVRRSLCRSQSFQTSLHGLSKRCEINKEQTRTRPRTSACRIIYSSVQAFIKTNLFRCNTHTHHL
jgi:hypothetical protein